MFSAEAKNEIAGAPFERSCCAAMFVRGLTRFLGGAARRSDTPAARTVAVTQRAAVARAMLRAAKRAGLTLHAHTIEPTARRKNLRFAVVSDGPIGDLSRFPQRACCRRAWLRGAFLARGSVADPHRAYHLEFVCPDNRAARALTEVLASFGIDAAVMHRRRRPVIYVKGAPAVVDVLGQLGANRAVLAFDNVLAVRATKNAIRRRVNSESANAARAAVSAARQRQVAMDLNTRAKLAKLTPVLREAVALRLAHPEATLMELASAARPQISKPAMAARMRTLARIARRRGSSQSRTSSRGGRRTVPKRDGHRST